ncbi:alpha/beta fold hydrolase [Streptomyces sp. NPDC047928]|uniref:alpha/beta fold hydrolase n=1 Tax=unclassified Streptomyces TaxID=2593676 RepID=UPI00372475BA
MTEAPLPVVLLHALPFGSAMWDAQARSLRARGHRVVALDQRGFGAAPLGDPAPPPSLEVVADDLVRALDERGMDRVVLVGSSMGGYAAMAFLRRRPERVAALALLAARGTADGAEAAAGRRAFADAMLDGARRDGIVAATTPLLVGATTRARRPEVVARVMADAAAADPAAVAWAQRAIADRPDSLDVLRAADVPAVVVAGGEDGLVPVAEAGATADALPRGKLVVVPDAGHLQPLECPGEVTGILTDLLEEAAC